MDVRERQVAPFSRRLCVIYSSLQMTGTASGTAEGMLGQVERIIHSETFHNAGALRRLLIFLAEKSASGEAEHLKEYSVGIDGLGRSPDYDPRRDSGVRLQVSRLRQKLAEYYRTEGKEDPLVIDLPKGRFKLTCEFRTAVAEPLHQPSIAIPEPPPAIEASYPRAARVESRWRRTSLLLAMGLVAAITWASWATYRLTHKPSTSTQFEPDWTSELEELWRPFLTSDRPLIVSIADPLFIQFKGFGVYRELTINDWDEVAKSRSVAAIRSSLNSPEMARVSRYATLGEVNASFLLGKLLAPHFRHISLSRSSELSWQQLADNNVLFIGAERIITQHLQAMPVDLALRGGFGGVQNLHPRPGEPAFLADHIQYGASDDGEAFAIISRVPGPGGQGDIETFTSDSTPGRVAAVQWFTNPSSAKVVASKLRKRGGQIPRYYQLVLKVKFKDGVPTETSYVMHRELRSNSPAAPK
jgi:hypothetical protein